MTSHDPIFDPHTVHHRGFGPIERAVRPATGGSLASGRISDATWFDSRRLLVDDASLVELVAVIGSWSLFSNFLRTLDVPLEDSIEPWPPDGARPV